MVRPNVTTVWPGLWMTMRWMEKNSFSAVPMKKAKQPSPSEIVPRVIGRVRFNGTKPYAAEVIAVGK